MKRHAAISHDPDSPPLCRAQTSRRDWLAFGAAALRDPLRQDCAACLAIIRSRGLVYRPTSGTWAKWGME